MVHYRRNRVPGGTYFFTVTLKNRRSALLVKHIDALRRSFREVHSRQPFHIDAIVILPDHIHALWTLPTSDSDFSARWQAIKSRFTRAIANKEHALTQNTRGEYNLWQRRFWEHSIRDTNDFTRHVDYIHYNPVKHGYTTSVGDWPYSSFHRYVDEGRYPADWGRQTVNYPNVGHE